MFLRNRVKTIVFLAIVIVLVIVSVMIGKMYIFGRVESTNTINTITYTYPPNSIHKYPPYNVSKLYSCKNLLGREDVEEIISAYLLRKGYNIYTIDRVELVNSTQSLAKPSLTIKGFYYDVSVELGNGDVIVKFRISPCNGVIEFIGVYVKGFEAGKCNLKLLSRYAHRDFVKNYILSEFKLMDLPINSDYSINVTSVEVDEKECHVTVWYTFMYKGYVIDSTNTYVRIYPTLNLSHVNAPDLVLFDLIREDRVRMNISIGVDDLRNITGEANIESLLSGLVLVPVDVNCDLTPDVLELCYVVKGYNPVTRGYGYYVSSVTGEILYSRTLCSRI